MIFWATQTLSSTATGQGYLPQVYTYVATELQNLLVDGRTFSLRCHQFTMLYIFSYFFKTVGEKENGEEYWFLQTLRPKVSVFVPVTSLWIYREIINTNIAPECLAYHRLFLKSWSAHALHSKKKWFPTQPLNKYLKPSTVLAKENKVAVSIHVLVPLNIKKQVLNVILRHIRISNTCCTTIPDQV